MKKLDSKNYIFGRIESIWQATTSRGLEDGEEENGKGGYVIELFTI